ncbi:MAG: flavin reductase, partial [Steroidobacteraceae bacterium]
IECRVTSLHPGGDHTIIVGQIEAISTRSAPPLAFHGSRFGRFTSDPTGGAIDVWPDPRGAWM